MQQGSTCSRSGRTGSSVPFPAGTVAVAVVDGVH